MIRIKVVNTPPEKAAEEEVNPELLDIFHRSICDSTALPFVHQNQVFDKVLRNQEVVLMAGTAAGKTLAIAVPLFAKLKSGNIRHVIFLYPTLALLEDQRKTMDRLGEITGVKIGEIKGGISRAELITALNKPVLLATPDAVYWLFHKDVKYSSLFIYGLALMDEWVLDEAHLFNGLMLRNLWHLKQRVKFLSKRIGKKSRWHILTATPTKDLLALTEGMGIKGQSKCGNIEVTFLEPVRSYGERRDKLINAVEYALANGAQKVLLVFNSADLAHRVFEEVKGKTRLDLPVELKWRFGRIAWNKLKPWLEKEVEMDIVENIERFLKREEPLCLKDLPEGSTVILSIEQLIAEITKLLGRQVWGLKRLAYAAAREDSHNLIESIERKLISKSKLAKLLCTDIRSRLRDDVGVEDIAEALDAWATEIQTALERIWTEDTLSLSAPDFPEITAALREAGIASEIAAKVTEHLKYTVKLPEEIADELKTSPEKLAKRHFAFPWIGWLIKDKEQRKTLSERVQKALAQDQLEVETKHIAVWGDSEVPIIIYTGKISKSDRRGLIDAFEVLPQAVLISTSAVEVGVDFAADYLITEQCDGNAFLQRIGRIGRRPGIEGKAVVLVNNGEAYVELYKLHKPQMTREDFSGLIANPREGIFPVRLYVEGSDFLDATHWLINAQLGQIGQWLNQAMFGEGEMTGLARELQAAGLPFAYGLRSTLPGVSLRGEAGGGEPFYILRKVPNERLFSTDSPFEMAQADMWYLEFLWRPSVWKRIIVDVEETLRASQAISWWQDGRWRLRASYGITADYLKLFSDAPVSGGQPLKVFLKALERRIKEDLAGLLSELRLQADKPLPRLLLRIGEALPLFFEPHNCLVLGQGNVHLLRVDQDDIASLVEDALGNPLVLPDQTWLLLYGYNREKAEELLGKVSALNLGEVIYDWGTLEVPGSLEPMLLDRVAGACFDIYRRLVAHVGG